MVIVREKREGTLQKMSRLATVKTVAKGVLNRGKLT